MLAWLLVRVLLLLLVGLAIGRVVLVIIAVLVIAIIVLLVSIIAVIIIARLVVWCVPRLEIVVLVVVVGALIIGAMVVVILSALLRIVIALLAIGRWEMVFNSACEAFEAFSHVGTTVRTRKTAVSIFVIFASPKECFAVAKLNIGVGIELEPSAEKARFCVLDQFAECGTFSDEFVIVRISGEIAFKLISESTNLIISEFFRLLAGETFEVVFCQ